MYNPNTSTRDAACSYRYSPSPKSVVHKYATSDRRVAPMKNDLRQSSTTVSAGNGTQGRFINSGTGPQSLQISSPSNKPWRDLSQQYRRSKPTVNRAQVTGRPSAGTIDLIRNDKNMDVPSQPGAAHQVTFKQPEIQDISVSTTKPNGEIIGKRSGGTYSPVVIQEIPPSTAGINPQILKVLEDIRTRLENLELQDKLSSAKLPSRSRDLASYEVAREIRDYLFAGEGTVSSFLDPNGELVLRFSRPEKVVDISQMKNAFICRNAGRDLVQAANDQSQPTVDGNDTSAGEDCVLVNHTDLS
jgi:hypothetical protein